MTITSIQASVTKTSAFTTTPDIDISGITTDWELHLKIHKFTADAGVAPVARFAFTDSVDAFSNSLSGPTAQITGQFPDGCPDEFCFKKRDFPGMRFGTTSAVLRLVMQGITGTNAEITYSAHIVS